MKTPNIIALPTSQMQALCDVLELPSTVQSSMESMILALEITDFSKVKVVKAEPGKPRERFTIGYELDTVSENIVAQRKVALGRT